MDDTLDWAKSLARNAAALAKVKMCPAAGLRLRIVRVDTSDCGPMRGTRTETVICAVDLCELAHQEAVLAVMREALAGSAETAARSIATLRAEAAEVAAKLESIAKPNKGAAS